MSSINFFYEDTSFTLEQPEAISEWITNSIETENGTLSEINYIFCSDEFLHKINVEYLNHDYYTDIITFDNSDEEGTIEGDLYISVERVEDNASKIPTTFLQELHRVMIHGVLHLLGYNDKTATEKEVMREKENAYLSLSKF